MESTGRPDPVEQSKTTPSLVTKEQYSINSIKQHNLIQSDVIDTVTTATNTVILDTIEDSTMYKLTEEENGDKNEDELIVDAIEEIVQALKTENSKTQWKENEKPQMLQDVRLAMLKKRLYNSNTTVATLRVLEKAIQQNNFRNEQIHYKGVPIAPFRSEHEENSNDPLSLQYLFEFKSDATHKKIVTSMSSHSISSKDILAVGYENGEKKIDEDGLVLLWSLRNPSFPEKSIPSKFGPVTALAFSQENTTVLAVGQSNGTITLLDTVSEKMVTTSNGSSEFQHWNAIVDLKWVKEKGQELLLSTSIDGKVFLWSTQKGLTSQPLATLKQNLRLDYKSFEYQEHKNATIETKPPGLSLPSEFLIKLKSLLQKEMSNEEMTKVIFSPDEKLLFVGDVLGGVRVFKVRQ